MVIIGLFQCGPWCLPTQNWLQVATNDISIQEFHNITTHQKPHYAELFTQCTIVNRGPRIMAKIFGIFGTKTCSFIKENRTKNGPLVFRTVLCSKHDEKLGNCQRKTLRQVVGCGIVRFQSIFVCQVLELARNHMVLLLGKLCDRNLYSTINFAEITGSAMFK